MPVETIYALMAIIPAVFLVIMVLLGIDTDADVDIDMDADIDVDVDVDTDIDSEVTTGGGPGLFSMKLILGFVTGFGTFGFLAKHYNWPSHHLIIAALGGFAFYYILYRFVKILYDFQANSQITGSSLIGLEAEVINQMKEGGTGEIEVNDPKTNDLIVFRAKAKPQHDLNKGDLVKILHIQGNLAIVRGLRYDASDVKSVIKHSQLTDED